MLKRFMKPGMFFDADGGGAGGAGGTGGDGGAGGEKGKENTPETKPYTQAQLDQMMADRAARAEKSATEKLLADLGVTTPEEAKAILAAEKARKDGEKTELQKAQDALAAAEKVAAEAKTAGETALQTATDKLKMAEVKAEAVAAGFLPAAIPDVWSAVDKTKITEKDGVFVGVKEAVAAVATAKPHWIGPKPPARGTPTLKDKKTEGDGSRTVAKPAIRSF